jgi:hypothetical protein
MQRLLNRRQQGDLGEVSAIDWLTRQGAVVCAPLGHSPDYDLVAELDGQLLRVQVKTSIQEATTPDGHLRYPVMLATSGGNQSWNRRVKSFDPSRFYLLFVLVGCGRRWMVPAGAIEANNLVTLGGRKYSEFEVESVDPIADLVHEQGAGSLNSPRPGGVSKRSTDGDCKSSGSAFAGSNPASSTPDRSFAPVRFERSLGRCGQTVISRKRLVTVPLRPAVEAGMGPGDRIRVRADGPGRLVFERVEEPAATPAPGAAGPPEGA